MYGAEPEKGHSTPEAFRWKKHGEAARVSTDVLQTAVRAWLRPRLLGRYWPKRARHDSAAAVAGGLRRAGWLEEPAVKFVWAICAAANDEQPHDRIKYVRDTFAKDKDDKLTGWKRLIEILGEKGRALVGRVTEWLGIGANSRDFRDGVSGSAPKWNPPAPLPEMPPVPAFPIHLFPSKVADYWLAAAESLGYPVDFVAVPALPLLGAAAGRSIAVEVKRNYKEPPLLWCGLVAPPGAVKSPSLTFAQGPLPMIAVKWIDEFKQNMKAYRCEKMRYEEEVKDWKKSKCQGAAPKNPSARRSANWSTPTSRWRRSSAATTPTRAAL